jgi:serine/threonine protein kinase
MTPDRWQTIERLYHATLERRPSERDGFLAGACQGDEALRTEVESLIAHGLDAPAILDAEPSRELRAALTRRFDEQPGVPGRYLGRMFGPYKLQAVLAAGGMGEVYHAADTRLNRTVAIKILLHDPERQELTREAEIVSSLNHPHICTITTSAARTASTTSSWSTSKVRRSSSASRAARSRSAKRSSTAHRLSMRWTSRIAAASFIETSSPPM